MVSLYIASYFVLMTILFGNLFFGLLLSVCGTLYDVHKSGRRLTHEEIHKAETLQFVEGSNDDDDNNDDKQNVEERAAVEFFSSFSFMAMHGRIVFFCVV